MMRCAEDRELRGSRLQVDGARRPLAQLCVKMNEKTQWSQSGPDWMQGCMQGAACRTEATQELGSLRKSPWTVAVV